MWKNSRSSPSALVYAEGVPAETLLNFSLSNSPNTSTHTERQRQEEARCAPYVHTFGGRDEFMSRFRSALSLWTNLRNLAEVIRDRLEEYG
jgi:uncharacterized membrane protein